MMLESTLFLAAALQTAFAPAPAPAPPALPGTEIFERDRIAFQQELRRACISEPGVRIIVDDWSRQRANGPANRARWQSLQQEKAEAAYGSPFDMERFEAALTADAQREAEAALARARDGISLLHRLNPADRAIYARRFTSMRPEGQAPSCGDNRR